MIIESICELTIYEVEAVQTLFLDSLKKNENIIIDMKSVEKLDMVGIQLLLSFYLTAHTQNIHIEFINITPIAREQIDICNCIKALGITDA